MQRTALSRPLGRLMRPRSFLRRPYSTPPSKLPPPPSRPRIDRVLARLPPSMQRYTRRLKDAPVSHVAAFLLLHELTAVLPLAGLFGLFHYLGSVESTSSGSSPVLAYMVDNYGEQVEGGIARFEQYFRKKGWLGGEESAGEISPTPLSRWSDARYRIVVEVGVAYAATKLLLPVRIAASLWATPWLAGVLQRLRPATWR